MKGVFVLKIDLYADLVIYNGRLITVNENDEITEAVAVKDNKILAVGTNDEIKEYIDDNTRVIDANKKTIMPGMIDTHVHYLILGLLGRGLLDINYPKVKSIEEIKDIIREEVKKKKKGEWIVLEGYDHNRLEERRHPTKEDLDEVAPDNPVQCTRICHHMGVYNTRGLEAGNIGDGRQFADDEVIRYEDGSLTGLLKETAHMVLSEKVTLSDEVMIDGLENANKILLENGITSVHDAGSYGKNAWRNMQFASKNSYLKSRVYTLIWDLYGKQSNIDTIDNFISTGIYSGLGDEKYRIGPVKIMLDGSSTGPSIATLEPYSHDPTSSGMLMWEQEEIDDIVDRAHRAGFQVTAHAQGDRAISMLVTAIERALEKTPREDHRHRIEHCGLVNDDLLERIGRLGLVPTSNPTLLAINGTDYLRFYGDRVEKMFALKSFKDYNINATLASDATASPINPMYSFYGALNRKDMATGEDVGLSQKVDVLDVVRMFTYNGAHASFEEDIKGSIEVGKLADIVVLSEDILEYPKEDVLDIKVDYTIIDGVVEYER